MDTFIPRTDFCGAQVYQDRISCSWTIFDPCQRWQVQRYTVTRGHTCRQNLVAIHNCLGGWLMLVLTRLPARSYLIGTTSSTYVHQLNLLACYPAGDNEVRRIGPPRPVMIFSSRPSADRYKGPTPC